MTGAVDVTTTGESRPDRRPGDAPVPHGSATVSDPAVVIDAEPGEDAGPDEIAAHIDRTRAQWGDTVSALAAKFDVPARMRETRSTARQAAGDLSRRVRSAATPRRTMLAVAGTIAAIGGTVIWRRSR